MIKVSSVRCFIRYTPLVISSVNVPLTPDPVPGIPGEPGGPGGPGMLSAETYKNHTALIVIQVPQEYSESRKNFLLIFILRGL